MTRLLKKISVALMLTAFVVLAYPFHVDAAILQPSYSLLSPVIGTSVNGQTGFVTITGMTTALTGQQPQNALIRFKTNIVGQTTIVEQPIFNPLAGGSFEQTLTGFSCGQTYRFKLYEMPMPDTTGGTESLINWGNSIGFDYVMSCGTAQTGGGDIMTTFSDASMIGGVNWGSIVSTDTSISMTGAHLLPLLPTTVPKKFKIEYGYGYAGQSNYNDVVGYTNVQTANPPNYNFSANLTGLMPNTSYYFTLLECEPSGDPCYNLFTYGFAPTDFLTGQGLSVNATPTTVIVSGQLESATGTIFYNLPIEIVIKDQNGQVLMTNTSVTGPQAQFGVGGNFQSVFNNITASGLVAGQSYTYTIMSPAPGGSFELTVPQPFTVPTVANPSTTATVAGPDYTGLVACGLDPENYDCDFNTFLETVNRVVNFLILFVAFPVVALVIAWAGILLLTSGGSPGAKEKAKSMIGKVIVGLIVALLAWVIIKLVLVVFGYTSTGPLWQILNTTP